MHLSDFAKNVGLDSIAGDITHVAIHADGTPGKDGTGTAEIGARQPVSWNPADLGAVDASSQPEFPVPGSTTVGGVSLWSAVSGGTCYGGVGVSLEVFGGPGTYLLTQITIDLNAAQ